MRRYILMACVFLLWMGGGAWAQLRPSEFGVRYSGRVANAPAGVCGCFVSNGVGADVHWRLAEFASSLRLGVAVDLSVDHAPNIHATHYGLTVTSISVGPRLALRRGRYGVFGQFLLGYARGSNSFFPHSGNRVTSDANTFAVLVGGGVEYSLTRNLSLRVAQMEYQHTGFPNGVRDGQNNMRFGAGMTYRFK